MGLDKKELKIAKKAKEKITSYLKEIERFEIELVNESDKRKVKKIEEKINIRKSLITDYSKELSEIGWSLEEFSYELNDTQKNILNDIFPYGLGVDTIGIQGKRNEIINQYKDWIKKLKKLREEYPPYDASLPVKQKLKNKIYKQEKDIGWLMLGRSNPDYKAYDPEWNYKEHFATSTEFTQEERDIIEHCIKIGEEYDKYLDERYGFLAEIGESLCKKGEAIKEWGDITQARIWTRNQVNDTMPGIVKYLNPNHVFTDEELHSESKELFKRFLNFIGDKDELNKALKIKDKIMEENLEEVNQLRATTRNTVVQTKGVLRKSIMGHIEKRMEKLATDAEDVLVLEHMTEKIGSERAMFVFLYTSSEEAQQGTDELVKYSFEELGLK